MIDLPIMLTLLTLLSREQYVSYCCLACLIRHEKLDDQA